MPPRLFTPDEASVVVQEYLAGATTVVIAARRGCSPSGIARELRRQGVQLRVGTEARTRWTGSSEQLDELDGLYSTGATVHSLARKYSCRTDLVADALRARGHAVYRGRERIPPAKKAELIARSRKPGSTVRALAREFGMSEGAVSSLLKRSGEPPRVNEWTPELQQQVVAQYQSGMSQQRIADLLGLRQPTVSARLRAAGVLGRRKPASGAAHGSWRGGRVELGGYAYVRPTPADLAYCVPNSSGYVAEHRLAVGRLLGRPLLRSESVHHINGERADNRLENLQLRQGQHGSGVVMTCNACGSHDVSARRLT